MVKPDDGSKMIFAPADAVRPLPCFFDYLNDDLVRMVVWATTEGGAVRPPAALRGVDQRLRTIVKGTRIWRDEWVDMFMERNQIFGTSWPRSTFEAGGSTSIEKWLRNQSRVIEWNDPVLVRHVDSCKKLALVSDGNGQYMMKLVPFKEKLAKWVTSFNL